MKNIKLYEYLFNKVLLQEECKYREALKRNCPSTELDDLKERITRLRANLLSSNARQLAEN